MPIYQADWLLPIETPPVRHGWVRTEAGRIAAFGGPETRPVGQVVRLEGSAILPGLVNAHTHLELSWLRDRIAPADNFVDWIEAMMRVRKSAADADDVEGHRRAMDVALGEMRASGTAAVGDISNTLVGLDLFAAHRMAGMTFFELLGFNGSDPAGQAAGAQARAAAASRESSWPVSLAPHAPYTVSPGLMAAIDAVVGEGVTCVHVAEGADEDALLRDGTGRWPGILRQMGVWDEAWRPPASSAVEYVDRLGFWRPGRLAVHAVRAGATDLALLRERGAIVVTCPRSNGFVGAGAPPVRAFYASGVRVAVGTDSLTSVRDLNLFSELAALRALAPDVPPGRLLASATIEGARALGVDRDFGSVAVGKRDALIAVTVPSSGTDVEHDLTRGVTADRITWLDGTAA